MALPGCPVCSCRCCAPGGRPLNHHQIASALWRASHLVMRASLVSKYEPPFPTLSNGSNDRADRAGQKETFSGTVPPSSDTIPGMKLKPRPTHSCRTALSCTAQRGCADEHWWCRWKGIQIMHAKQASLKIRRIGKRADACVPSLDAGSLDVEQANVTEMRAAWGLRTFFREQFLRKWWTLQGIPCAVNHRSESPQ